jgi:hypothetical protein
MTQSEMMKLGMAAAVLFAGYKWGSAEVRTASVALAAVIAGKRLPVVKDVL